MTTNDISTTTNLNQISETQMRWAILYFVFVFLFFGSLLNLSTCAVCIRVTKSADHWLHFEMEILCVAFGHSRRYSMQETWVLKVRRRPNKSDDNPNCGALFLRCVDDTCGVH